MAVVAPTTEWHWPAEVVAFAGRHEVRGHLAPLRDLLTRLYPAARCIRVFLEDDPEVPADQHIVFEVQVATADAPDYLAATRAWYEESPKIAADPLCLFRLQLLRVA